ncbi:flocculation protein FLO11-like [Solea senegalensis]|uniref:Flocculation protein FLO11-like n=1 Tax=Solea senegalensis TaxID=28829 RepID=A0AAV6P8D2_SOLSE|nr:uncharacterized protein LOC122762059 [Solea senegalensis]KAG7453337.1 flocculation protein FLO11-like [Solea senegalensis]
MQRYWWPGFEKHLLGKLQKQQNNGQFCDTLLHTEGISVPTHSCVLAALSPYLSRKLSASPCPPSGQKHQLQLHAVKAKTLLKLVSLLYSGELEVKGSVEQNDVMALARRFEIADLVERQKGGGLRGAQVLENGQSFCSCRENGFHTEGRGTSDKWRQDAQVQAAFVERKDREKRTTGTQTDKAVVSVDLSTQTSHPTAESAPSVDPSLDYSVSFQPQHFTLDNQFHFTSCSVIPHRPFRAPSADSSSLDPMSGIVINPIATPALSSDSLTVHVSLNNNSNAPRHQDDGTCQQSSEFEDSSQVLSEDGTDPENGKRDGETTKNRGDTEQPSRPREDGMPGGERAKSRETRPARVSFGMKSPAKMKRMQEMMEDTHISIKVKLRRRTKGQMWEVVSVQDSDEAVSVLASLEQVCLDPTTSNTDLPNVPPTPSTDQTRPVQNPDSHSLQPDANNSHKTPPPHQTTSSQCLTLNQRNGLEGSPLLQCQGSVEESEQIERLLEDIMMGLNILPNLERDCEKAHHHVQPTALQVPVTHEDIEPSQVHSAVSAAAAADGAQNCNSSTDTGIQCCLTSENQPSCSGLFSAPPNAALIQQQQDCPSQYHQSVRSMWQRDGSSHQSLFKSHQRLHPAAPTPRSAISSAFFAPGQKMHFPAFPGPSPRDGQHNPGFLPLKNGKELQSMHNLSLLYMADMRLPQCLSPLPSCTSLPNHPSLVNPVNLGDKIQKQPSLYGRPWLTENPSTLKIPLSTIAQSAPLTKDTNRGLWLKKQENLNINQQNQGTCTESCTAKEVEETEKSAGQKSAPEPKPEPRKKRKRRTEAGSVQPKKKKQRPQVTSHPPDAVASVSEHKVSDATKSQINLSICQVSLSSNNVLAKEREMAASSSNLLSKYVGKPNKPLLVTDSLMQESGQSRMTTNPTRIRTRGYLKKKDDKTNANTDKSVAATSIKVERNDKPDEGINDRIPERNPGVRKPGATNYPRVVILKEFQKLIKMQHSKTTKSKERQRRNKVAKAIESEVMASRDDTIKESSTGSEVDVDMTWPQDTSEESQEVFGVAFDKNHNQIFSQSTYKKSISQRDDTIGQETCESRDDDRTAFLFDGMEEEVTKMAVERERPPKNPDEGTTCDTGQLNTTEQTAGHDEVSSHTDLSHKTGPPLSEACGISRTSGCEEDEEEEEVDVLLYSPVKTQTKEDGLQNMHMSSDEEEEDMNEIDVTGDEAE